ncbi:MAG: thiol:disulfide interchange protein DsbA/DsbL [Gammaproteobacteria bacterium]|nr:thiol:disulfide interchange protein DsbA/DsbL [Gammaproteobacteria bacterium]
MKMVTKWLMVLVLPCFMVAGALAGDYTEGKEYSRLKTPQPTSTGDSIEVVELFWYGCPHCYRLEPVLEEWLASKPGDVEFIRIPAVLGPNWVLYGKAYYTAEFLGVSDKIHTALFNAIHKDKKKIPDVASLQALFVEQGVSAEDFDNTFNSFAVNVKMNNAKQMTKRYAVTGVPTIVVNGKYNTSASQAGSNQNIINIMDYLIAQERSQAAASSTQ